MGLGIIGVLKVVDKKDVVMMIEFSLERRGDVNYSLIMSTHKNHGFVDYICSWGDVQRKYGLPCDYFSNMRHRFNL